MILRAIAGTLTGGAVPGGCAGTGTAPAATSTGLVIFLECWPTSIILSRPLTNSARASDSAAGADVTRAESNARGSPQPVRLITRSVAMVRNDVMTGRPRPETGNERNGPGTRRACSQL